MSATNFLARTIPQLPHHEEAYSVVCGQDGKIYFSACTEFGAGLHAHVFAYDPTADSLRDVVDLTALLPEARDRQRPPHSKIHTAMCVAVDGKIYFATHFTAPPPGVRYVRIFDVLDDPERCYTGAHLVCYDPQNDSALDLGIVAPREGCRWMSYNPEQEELYLVSCPRVHFLVYRLRSREVLDLGRISQHDALGPCWSAAGYVFTTDDDGNLLRYDPRQGRIEQLPVRIPDAPWRGGHENRARRMKVGPDGVRLFGFGSRSMHFFEYNPTDGPYGHMTDHGLICGEERWDGYSYLPPGKAMVWDQSGALYVAMGNIATRLYGDPGPHLFRFDLQTHETVDFGLMQANGLPPTSDCQDAALGADGRLYFASAVAKPPLQLLCFDPQQAQPAPARPEPAIPLNPWGQLDREGIVERADDYIIMRSAAFVRRGSLFVHDLGWPGKGPVIPPNERSITALQLGPNGRLYGATSGQKGRLFVYSPQANLTDVLCRVLPLGPLPEGQSCRCLQVAPDGRIYGGTFEPTGQAAGHLFVHDPALEVPVTFDSIEGWALPREPFPYRADEQVRDLGAPWPGQGIWALALASDGRTLWGLTTPDAHLVRWEMPHGPAALVAQVPKGLHLARVLHCDAQGNVWTSGADGRLFRYDPQAERLEDSGLTLPCQPARELYNGLDALLAVGQGLLFGSAAADGILFTLDLEQRQIRPLGKPGRASRVRALTQSGAVLYGFVGEPGWVGRLFQVDLQGHTIHDLGLPRAMFPKEWAAYDVEAMAAGPDGEIYLGESGRLGHLMVYRPPLTPSSS
ncbi:MAG: hypothetical protein GX605_02405 [Chloroflexi bacterium]|nr:hypothetical protein [Chloroflexota bacterium]